MIAFKMNIFRIITTIILIPMLFSGCTKVAHLDELLTLKSFSDDQKITNQDVDKKNNQFDMLLAMVQSGDISRYKDKSAIVEHFGAPILSRERTENGKKIDEWIYRYQTNFFDSPKVYLQFDESQALIKWLTTDVKK